MDILEQLWAIWCRHGFSSTSTVWQRNGWRNEMHGRGDQKRWNPFNLLHSTPMRKLVFCQFKGEMNYQKNSCPVFRIEDIQSERRESQLAEFNRLHGIGVFIQVKAGGQGLNIQCASRVYTISPWESGYRASGIGRCHRTVKREVYVKKSYIRVTRRIRAWMNRSWLCRWQNQGIRRVLWRETQDTITWKIESLSTRDPKYFQSIRYTQWRHLVLAEVFHGTAEKTTGVLPRATCSKTSMVKSRGRRRPRLPSNAWKKRVRRRWLRCSSQRSLASSSNQRPVPRLQEAHHKM